MDQADLILVETIQPGTLLQIRSAYLKQLLGEIEPHQVPKAHLTQNEHVPAGTTTQIQQGLFSGRIEQTHDSLNVCPRFRSIAVRIEL
jgi:hypothetical protein